MSEKVELSVWFQRVLQAESAQRVFHVLDQFRKEQWSDEDCAKMAKLYMKHLDRVGGGTQTEQANDTEDGGIDGPVWYEKM